MRGRVSLFTLYILKERESNDGAMIFVFYFRLFCVFQVFHNGHVLIIFHNQKATFKALRSPSLNGDVFKVSLKCKCIFLLTDC